MSPTQMPGPERFSIWWHPLAAVVECRRGRFRKPCCSKSASAMFRDGEGSAAVWRSRPELPAGSPSISVRSAAVCRSSLPMAISGPRWGRRPPSCFPIPEYCGSRSAQAQCRHPSESMFRHPALSRTSSTWATFLMSIPIFWEPKPHTEVKEYDVELSVEPTRAVARAVASPTDGLDASTGERCGSISIGGRIPIGRCVPNPAPSTKAASTSLRFPSAGRSGACPRAHDALCPRRKNEDKVIKRFQQTDFRPGQTDPGRTSFRTFAARPGAVDADPRRKSADRLPPLASQKGVTYGASSRRHLTFRNSGENDARYSKPDGIPVAASYDLPFRHVFHAQLLGREFAVWRADDATSTSGRTDACTAGVRLSIGINDGRGVEVFSITAGAIPTAPPACTYIPAHPADAPARHHYQHVPLRASSAMASSGRRRSLKGMCRTLRASPKANLLTLRGIPVNAPAMSWWRR